jgi:hypothetical protein
VNARLVKDAIALIRRERRRRLDELPDHEWAYDEWQSHHEPFVNDLCLMLLVAMRHEVERELVKLAAKVTGHGRPLRGDEYAQRVLAQRASLVTRGKGWKSLIATLKLKSFPEWDSSMETLRLVSNSYKHAPTGRPDVELLKHLHLDRRRKYAPLSESDAVRKRLAKSLRLRKSVDYCDIAEELLKRAAQFLKDVASQPSLSPVKYGALSIRPRDAEH